MVFQTKKNGKKTMNETAYSLTMFKKIHKESNIDLKNINNVNF